MNHPIENRYRYGLCYDLNGQIVGFNLSPDVFVGLTDEEIESALEAYVKRKHELPSVQPEQITGKWEYLCYQNMKCSKCGYVIAEEDNVEFRFCPNCGCRMEEGE